MPTRGYLSQSEQVVTLGLGEATTIDELTVEWPNGNQQKVTVDKLKTILTVEQE